MPKIKQAEFRLEPRFYSNCFLTKIKEALEKISAAVNQSLEAPAAGTARGPGAQADNPVGTARDVGAQANNSTGAARDQGEVQGAAPVGEARGQGAFIGEARGQGAPAGAQPPPNQPPPNQPNQNVFNLPNFFERSQTVGQYFQNAFNRLNQANRNNPYFTFGGIAQQIGTMLTDNSIPDHNRIMSLMTLANMTFNPYLRQLAMYSAMYMLGTTSRESATELARMLEAQGFNRTQIQQFFNMAANYANMVNNNFARLARQRAQNVENELATWEQGMGGA